MVCVSDRQTSEGGGGGREGGRGEGTGIERFTRWLKSDHTESLNRSINDDMGLREKEKGKKR